MQRSLLILGMAIAVASYGVVYVIWQRQHPYARQLTLNIRLDHRDYMAMEPILCNVTIKNTGTTPVLGFHAMYGAQEPCIIVVKNRKGRQMAATDNYKAQLQAAEKAKNSWAGHLVDPDLTPGQASGGLLTLNQYVGLTGMGYGDNTEFSVYIERFGVRSNVVTFKEHAGFYNSDTPSYKDFIEWRKLNEAHP